MIDGLAPIPEMKPSGLPWLGDCRRIGRFIARKYSFVKSITGRCTGEEELLSVSHDTGLSRRAARKHHDVHG